MNETCQKIIDALAALLQERSISSIKTGDVIAQAGVSRATFYRRFKDKHEVLSLMYQNQVDAYLAMTPLLADAAKQRVLIYRHIFENRTLYRNAVGYSGQNSFEEFLSLYTQERTTERLCCAQSVPSLSEELHFAVRFFSASAAHMVTDWIRRDFYVSPERLAELVGESMPRSLRELFDNSPQ